MSFTRPTKSIGIDIGTHSVKAVQMSRSGGKLKVEQAGKALIDRNQLNVEPVQTQANALLEALSGMNLGQSLLVGALAGQTAVIRYPRLPDMPRDQMDREIENEAGQNIPYDLSEVFLDWDELESVEDGDQRQLKILLVAAKHEIIESRVQIAEAGDIQLGILTVDSLALADAAECCGMLRGDETVAIINVGASSASIHFLRDRISNFIRDVSWGAREMIQAVAKARHCDIEEAEKILKDIKDVDVDAESASVPDDVSVVEPPQEPGEASTSSLLDPLDDELGGFGSQPPADVDSAVGSGDSIGFDTGQMSIQDILATPISRLVSEVRRSFDYYEHQLYESPVERIILSGGAAPLPHLRTTLIEELGVDRVDIADPSQGDLVMGSDYLVEDMQGQPSQFMVAVGLAARGMAEI